MWKVKAISTFISNSLELEISDLKIVSFFILFCVHLLHYGQENLLQLLWASLVGDHLLFSVTTLFNSSVILAFLDKLEASYSKE